MKRLDIQILTTEDEVRRVTVTCQCCHVITIDALALLLETQGYAVVATCPLCQTKYSLTDNQVWRLDADLMPVKLVSKRRETVPNKDSFPTGHGNA